MGSIRAFFAAHRLAAAWVVALALCMKVLVPGGYMLSAQSKVITVQLCDDTGAGHLTAKIAIPMKPSGGAEHGKGTGACPFSSLTHAALGGADPLLLVDALLFIVALGFLPMAPTQRPRVSHLRPPLRGPPALA